MKPGILETQKCGSPGYVAPEVLNGNGYDTKADIFSAGVILYILYIPLLSPHSLSGVSPFHANSYHQVLQKNRKGKIEFPAKYWDTVSPEGIDLIMKMTELNPAERITAADALTHRWFTLGGEKSKLLSSALENMRKYHNKDNENRFNVERIKPEFSSVLAGACLYDSRFASTNVGSSISNNGFASIFVKVAERHISPPILQTGRNKNESDKKMAVKFDMKSYIDLTCERIFGNCLSVPTSSSLQSSSR